jgi:hypothetical protein
MADKKKDKTLFKGVLKRVSQNNHDTVFYLINEETDVTVGKLSLKHGLVIDKTKRMGKEGFVTNPPLDYFPQTWELKIQS